MSYRASCSCHSHGGFLTAKGLEETAQRSLEGLGVDDRDASRLLDMVGSVSALRRDEPEVPFDDDLIDSQYRRFLSDSRRA